MRSCIRPGVVLRTLLASALLVTTVTAQGQEQVPFIGQLSGIGIPVGTTQGQATQLGQFSGTVTAVTIGPTGFSGVFTNYAANGDSVSGTLVVTFAPPPVDGVLAFTSTITVTGGTGRFEGASGSAGAVGSINVVTNVLEAQFSGTISRPNSD